MTCDFGSEEFVSTSCNNIHKISAYYFQPSDILNCTCDLGDLDWLVDHYVVEELL